MNNFINRKFLIEKDEIFLGIAVAFFVFAEVIEMTMFSIDENGEDIQALFLVTRTMRYAAYALCVIKILIDQKVTKNWIFCVIVVAALLLAGILGSHSRTMILYFLMIAAANGVSDKTILRVILFVQSAILIVTVVCSQLGIIEDFIYIQEERSRHYLGFTWTTTAPILFFYIILQLLYIRELNLSIWEIVVFALIDFWFFWMTSTRFAFILLLVTLALSFLFKYTSFGKLRLEKAKYLFILSPEIIAIFAIGLHALYDSNSKGWETVNSLLSHRLNLGYSAIQEYGISLLGQELSWYGHGIRSQVGIDGIEYNYVDCSYLQILIQYGLIFLILVLVAYSVIMWKAIKKKRYSACWIILIVLIFAITEPRLVNMAFNPFILLTMTHLETTGMVTADKKTSRLKLVLQKNEA